MSTQPIKGPVPIRSADPVALRHNQEEFGPPDRLKRWGEVACNGCTDKFFICQSEVHAGQAISPPDAIEKFEALLAKEHLDSRSHSNAYESTWGWQPYVPSQP
jgi:hypothetical protein